MKLLHIEFPSISGGQVGQPANLTASIVARLKQTIPGLEITYRDPGDSTRPRHQVRPTILIRQDEGACTRAGALGPATSSKWLAAGPCRGGAKVDASTQA